MTNSRLSPREAANELLRRRRARTNLHDFIRYINPDYIASDFSRSVCAELDRFLVAMMKGERPIIVFGAPPQHGKSDIVSRYLPAFVFGLYPNLRVAGLSYAMSLASSMNRDVQRIMMSDEYHTLFPETSLNERRTVTMNGIAKRNSEEFEVVGHSGAYIGQGVGGPLTGRKIDLGIIDDPIKNAQEASSETIKSGIWDWYTSTFLTRMSKNSGQIIMATRWAVDDLSGRVLERYPHAKSLVFKAIDDEGNALVPELHPLDKLLETKDVLGEYFWSAMYQQSPVPTSGGLFKPDMIQVVDALPAGLSFTRGWDFAATTKKTSDYTASVKLSVHDGITYIAHSHQFRGSPGEVEASVLSYASSDGKNTFQSYPQDPGAAGVAVAANLSRKLQGTRFEFTPETGDKSVRAQPFAAQVEAGNVRMLRGAWNSELIDALRHFPHAKHDDLVDAASRAYNREINKRAGPLIARAG